MSKHRLPTVDELRAYCRDRRKRPGWIEALVEVRAMWNELGEPELARIVVEEWEQ